MQDRQLIYIASPYTHEDPSIQDARVRLITAVTADILCKFPATGSILADFLHAYDSGDACETQSPAD